MTRAADWDAASYHQVAQPHAAWGADVLGRLELRGDELVLDAGCGSGKVTAQLLERLPRGEVIAADASPAMLAQAQSGLQRYADQVSFIQTDLLEIDRALGVRRVDLVFSTATFHWIADHQRLFGALHNVLRPGGKLIAQYGGGDNLAEFMRTSDAVAARQPYAQTLNNKKLWRFFYTPQQEQAWLAQAGFTSIEAWLEPSPQTFADAPALGEYMRTIVLSSHVGVLPEAQRDAFVNEVAEEIIKRQGSPTLDYVRINVTAVA
jgi:trans-aconitate 2-methyltransferase